MREKKSYDMEMKEKLFEIDKDLRKNMTIPIEKEVYGLRCKYKKGLVFSFVCIVLFLYS